MAVQALDARQIFLEAVEKHAPSHWPEFLETVCGNDAALRERVEVLLKAHGQYNQLLDGEGFVATLDQPLSERPGTQIGPYKLLQQIGEGGFGIVYMAEQTEPVRRRVALKVIKPGMDTRQVIARFEAERQALAVMDHPNIARVLDAGATESGRPYFVMELVRGTPITQYCDENNLPVRDRLELFASVCQAIQHAHTKGIIHRDIKPTNVLVTRQDGQPIVKVIDFGIAKAMGQQLTDKTLFTEFAQMIGTPLYMSPEQAELSSTDIDTRSDIYSLGVLLYELLTGSTPVSKEQLKQAAFDEIRRIIREEEPQKPSTRISTAEAAPSIAAQRHTEPAKLARLVRGELDWIVMKALEKDRNRRYETANGLARDIAHYLHDEAVVACPPSTGYRLRKFARRNKALLATGLVVSAAVLATVIVLAVSNYRIRRERNAKDVALKEKGEALQAAKANFAEARKQEQLATQNARRAEEQSSIALLNEKLAKAQTMLARRRLYASQMNLAMQAWRGGEGPRVLELLEGQRPQTGEDDLRSFEWYYLWRLCNGGSVYLHGHTDAVLSLSFSPDGKTMASTGTDETIRLWDTATGREQMLLRKLAPWDVTFSPDGQILACGGKTTPEVTLWNAATGELLHKLSGTTTGLVFSPDGRTLLGGGLSSKIWDVASGTQRAELPEEGLMLGMLPDSKTVVTLAKQFTATGEVRFWNAENGASRLTIPLPGAISAALSPDGAWIATAAGSSVKLWDTATGELRKTYATQTKIRALAISPDRKQLAGGGEDRRVIVWDIETGEQIGQDVHRDVVEAVAFKPDGKVIASGSLGGDIKLWDMTPIQEADSISLASVASLRFSKDSKTLLVGRAGPTSVIHIPAGKEVGVLPVSDVRAISGNGETAARLPSATRADFWSMSLGRDIASVTLPLVRNGSPGVAISPDGRLAATFVSWFGDGTVKLWDIATQQVRTFSIDPAPLSVTCAEFSPDGTLLAAGMQFQRVVVWDVAGGNVKLNLFQMPSMMIITALTFSPDGKALAVGTDIGVVTLWNVETGRQLAAFKGHTTQVNALAFSPDEQVLATASSDKTVRLWDVQTGQERSTLLGHTGPVSMVRFAPDGKTLATASRSDGTVKLWRAATDAEAQAPSIAATANRTPVIETASQIAGYRQLAGRMLVSGQLQDALGSYEQLLQLDKSLAPEFREIAGHRNDVAGAFAYFGLALQKGQHTQQAEDALSRALALWTELTEEDPANEWYRQERAYFSLALAILLQTTGRAEEALEHCRTNVRLNEQLVADFADKPVHQSRLAHGRGVFISLLSSLGRDEEIETQFELLRKGKPSAEELNTFAWAIVSRSGASVDTARLASEMAKKAVELNPGAGHMWNTLGIAQYRAGKWKDAIAALDKSRELRKGGDGFDWFFLALAHWQLDSKDEARKWYDQAVVWMDKNQPKNEELRRFRAEAEELMAIKQHKE
jgi:WD40 repeat protein/serine/threonine protein kinase/tetratricopeptide (TPR) repeat protein